MDRVPRETYHHGDLRATLLRSALALIDAEGVEALSLRRLAKTAGVSPAAPYHHFRDKEALLAMLAEEGFRALHTDLLTSVRSEPEGGTRAGLQNLALAYVRFAVTHPAHYRLMFGAVGANKAPYPSLQQASEEVFGLLRSGIEQLQRAGIVKPGDTRVITFAAWSLVHGYALLLLDGQVVASEPEAEALAGAITELLMFGMAMP